MFKSARSRLRAAVFACAAALGLGAYAASTYSTYKDDAETPTSDAFGNTMGQTFKLNATWMFNVAGDDIAASEAAVSLDSIKVYWHTAGHNNADIGKASGTQPDAYLVLTTPQNVVVGVSAVNDTAWSAGGSSTFAFSDTLISPNAQYYFYFATDVSAVQVGGSFSAGAQARFAGAWHGSSKTSDSDVHVGIGGSNTYSIRCDFAVSQTNAYASLETMSEGVNLSIGTDPVFVTGAVANGIVTVASGASVPSLTIVGEATTLALADTLSVGYLYLPAATTIDATGVTLAMPGDDETTATTKIVNGTISAASTPVVNLPTLPAGYDYGSTAIGDGITVTVTKSAGATLELTDGSVNWSDVKPADWVNGVASTITINYTGACTLVFDESVQAASITPVGTGSLVLERGTGATVDIAAVAIDQNAPAMDITFKNFTSIPPYSQYYTAATDVIRADGTETLVSHPLISTDDAHGSFYFTQPVTMDSFTLSGNKTAYFNTGATGTFGRFVLGNNGNRTQTVTQNDGTITVSGNAAPTSNQASILLGHWNGTVTLNTLGGTFNALNASTRLGWDGTATWAIGGGTDDAVANVLGIVNGENGHTGAGTLNIFANGTLNVGSGGIAFSNSGNGGVINLAGGTIKATDDMTIANAKAAGTILNQNKTTKLDTDEYTVTLSAPLSGSGVLNKQGSGTLKVTGAGTSTSRHEINGGTLLLSGNGATLGTGGFNMKGSGAHLDIEPGEGNTITLAADYLINSTSGNSSPVVNINAGTVENNCTGLSQYGQFGQSTINVNDGAELKLNNAGQLGWNMFTTLNVNNGGTLTIANTQQLTRQLKLNGGTVKLTGVDVPLETLGNRTITVTEDSSILAEATETAVNPALVVSNGTLTVSVASSKTLTLAAPVVDGASGTGIAQPVSKTGEGALKLTKANTATGTLTVSAGTLALDGGSWAGTVAVGAAGTLDVITSETVADGALLAAGTFTLAEGATVKENGTAVDVAVEADGIHKVAKVAVTVPVVANTVVTVTVGGETVSPTVEGGNIYKVAPGSVVTVTYAAADGYEISGTTVYTVDTASATTFEVTDTATAQYVAQIKTGATTYEKYTTLAAALDSENIAYGITLLADVTESDITVDSNVNISGSYAINANITVANGAQLKLMLATLNGRLTIQTGGTYMTNGGTLGEVVVQDGGIINLTTLSEDAAPLTVSTLTANGALTIVSSYGLAERGKTYKAISYATGSATIAEGASFNGSGGWSASTVVDGDNTIVCLEITKVAVVDGVYYDTAQEAVEAAVASGKQAEFLVQPGTVTLGAGETLLVKGGYQPTVELDAGLSTPPYEVESGYDIITGISTYAVVQKFAENQEIGSVTLAAAQAEWLNGQSNYDELAAKIATMTAAAFNDAYLLNLDITGEFSYEFKVTNINVGDTTVTMTVSLTRTGALDKTTKINGTVALTGTDELGKTFETISEATVADDDFSESNTTTISLDKGDAKFYLPVIE